MREAQISPSAGGFDGKVLQAIFAYARSNGNVLDLKELVLRSATIEEDINASGIRFTCPVTLDTLFMKGVCNLANTTFTKELEMKSMSFTAMVNFDSIKIEKGNRETFRTIKHECLRLNNKIDALAYYAKEMDAYGEELGDQLQDSSKTQVRTDLFILNISKYTNRHGTNWWLPLLWLGISTGILFVLYLCSVDEQILQHWFPFLWLGSSAVILFVFYLWSVDRQFSEHWFPFLWFGISTVMLSVLYLWSVGGQLEHWYLVFEFINPTHKIIDLPKGKGSSGLDGLSYIIDLPKGKSSSGLDGLSYIIDLSKDSSGPNGLSYGIDFLQRILSSFFIYQFIKGTRKYSKDLG
ncbi:hypothetical protein P0082_10110 [Candidatus Haliotispira prima]|uniref:Uncharacterized protein n=1 Tax=Candidatus Haliotispira prima TaxID=3034016 RepID=A0ABY8MFS9_9SPIO|nr:hypothetical protein P0082_10110 [Candidatus Haliotispira prima]